MPELGSTLASSTAVSFRQAGAGGERLVAVERVELAGEAAGLLVPGREEQEQPAGACRGRARRFRRPARGSVARLAGRGRLDAGVGHVGVHRREAGSKRGRALGQ